MMNCGWSVFGIMKCRRVFTVGLYIETITIMRRMSPMQRQIKAKIHLATKNLEAKIHLPWQIIEIKRHKLKVKSGSVKKCDSSYIKQSVMLLIPLSV